MTGKTVEVMVASRDVRRLVKMMPRKMSQNFRPFRVCLGVSFGACLISSEGPDIISEVTASCDIVLKSFGMTAWNQRRIENR